MYILNEKAHGLELTDEYKAMMDKLLEQNVNGELNYITKDEFFNRVKY